jgi:hypothetical protein
MYEIIRWLNEALDSKDLVIGMTYYRVANGAIKATNGRITASYPWEYAGEFLVAGKEFEKVLERMPEIPEIEVLPQEGRIRMRSGRYRGSIQTLPVNEWDYPGVDDAIWKPIPDGLLETLENLRPFVSDNAKQAWALGVALENGWAYATNNIALACVKCDGLAGIMALLPSWAIDFVLKRTERLTEWAWTDNYVAFHWSNGAWMRSQLIVGQFPEKAAELVRQSVAEQPTYHITDDFRVAFERVAELAEDTVLIYHNRIESKFGRAKIISIAECKTPEGAECSIWGAKFLLPALEVADYWSPEVWPKPAPFRGKIVSGYVVGRRM